MCCIPILPFPAMSLPDHAAMAVKWSIQIIALAAARTPPSGPVGLLVVSRTPSRAYDFRSGERADALSFLSQNNSLELTRLRFKRAAVIPAIRVRSESETVRNCGVRVRMFFCEIPDRQPSPGALLPGRATVRGPSGRAPARAAASAVGRSRGTRARALLSSLLSVRTSNAPTFFPIRI